MKRSLFFAITALTLVLALGAVGCKKAPKAPTPIPGMRTPPPGGGTPITPPPPAVPPGGGVPSDPNVGRTTTGPGPGIPTEGLDTFEGMLMDTNIFRANTVYFDFDRSTVRPSERAKVEDVAAQLKLDAYNKLLIEGHCDERGTEEYNRALGERRALALREYIVNLGISPDRIRTLSYGEDRPAVEGFDEAAWSRNRRGEFILLRPQ